MSAKKQSWSDVSPARRKRTVVAGIVQFALTGAVLADLRRRGPAHLRGSRRLWTAVAFVNFIGPIA